ncbi:MAG: hypothetical protein H3C26_15055 [Rhodocyclaceae bacterium]|nr:hypothetical protein [Rhodocyclaceae bacterium]
MSSRLRIRARLAALRRPSVRRSAWLWPLVLAAVLLVAQVGVHAHLIGHVGEATHAQGEAHDDPAEHAADTPCLACLALAGVDLPPLAADAAGFQSANRTPAFLPASFRGAGRLAPRPRCRAPPALFVSVA